MKLSHRLFILTLILVLSVASMAAAPSAKANKFPFAGLWKGVAADGGKNELRITYSKTTGVYGVNYVDKISAACAGGVATGRGFGKVVGNTLVTSFPVTCKNSGATVISSYNVGMVLGSAPLTAFDSAGTSYSMKKGVNCNGR